MESGPDQSPSNSTETSDVLLREWSALRQEILARIASQHRIVLTSTITIAGLAIAMKTILDQGWYPALVLIGMVFLALAAQYVEQDRLIARIGMYINWEIRPALERSLGTDAGVLGWEFFRGNPLSRPEKAVATTLSAVRYLPSLGAGIVSIAMALFLPGSEWPVMIWEWVLWLSGAVLGAVLVFAAYLTHRDYNLIWNRRLER